MLDYQIGIMEKFEITTEEIMQDELLDDCIYDLWKLTKFDNMPIVDLSLKELTFITYKIYGIYDKLKKIQDPIARKLLEYCDSFICTAKFHSAIIYRFNIDKLMKVISLVKTKVLNKSNALCPEDYDRFVEYYLRVNDPLDEEWNAKFVHKCIKAFEDYLM